MKKIFPPCPLLLLAVLSVFLTACSNDKYKGAVPADAPVVCSLNLSALDLGDADFKKSDAFSSLESLLDEIPDEELVDKLSEILEDPASMGIDLREPIYAFTTTDKFFGITMKVSKKKKVEEFLEFLSDQNWCDDLEEVDGLHFATLFENLEVAYNGDFLVGVLDMEGDAGERKLRRKLTHLLEQESSERFFDKANPFDGVDQGAFYCAFLNGNITEYAPYYVRRQINEFNAMLKKGTGLRLSDLALFASAKLEGSEMVCQIQLLGNDDKAQEKLEKLLVGFKPLKGDYATFFPGEGSAIFAIGAQGEKLLETLEKITRPIPEVNIKRGLKDFSRQTGVSLTDISNSLSGDVALTIADYYDLPYWEQPRWAFYASFTSTNFIGQVLNYFRHEEVPLEDLGGGFYRLGSDFDPPIINAEVYKDKIYLSNGTIAPGAGHAKLEEKMKGQKLFIYADLPEGAVDKIEGLFKTITVTSEDLLKYKIRIAAEDDSAGFLEHTLEALGKILSKELDRSSYSSSPSSYYDYLEEPAEEVYEEAIEEWADSVAYYED